MGKKGPLFYAVRRGRNPGIYTTWEECSKQVNGFPDALHKAFPTMALAKNFLGYEGKQPLKRNIGSKENQHRIVISGVEVFLPVKPYPAQIIVMDKVIRACRGQTNALLESPTGTGKTLALLCAALAWSNAPEKVKFPEGRPKPERNVGHDQEEGDEDEWQPTIYYTTRTHSQVRQVVKELSRTIYRPKMSVLGSRDQYCLNSETKNAPNKQTKCKELRDNHACSYHSNYQRLVTAKVFGESGKKRVWDIEDLVHEGANQGGCPYYASRDMAEGAEIVFCPYNYVLEPSIRDATNISLKGDVVIFDEAHNMEDIARDAASMDLRVSTLTGVAIELNKYADAGKAACTLAKEYQILRNVANAIKIWSQQGARSYPLEETLGVWQGEQLDHALIQCGLAGDNLVAFWKSIETTVKEANSEALFASPATLLILEQLAGVLRFYYSKHRQNKRDYRVVLKQVDSLLDNDAKDLLIGFWCFNPAVGFNELAFRCRSIVLASGTLSPMDSFASELAAEFPFRSEAPHVIDMKKRVWSGVVSSHNGMELLNTYQNTSRYEFQKALGDAVLRICHAVPDGVLCFFPSYAFLRKCLQTWKQTGLYASLAEQKVIVVEPTFGDQLPAVMKSFDRGIEKKPGGVTGSLLLAVCRGKISEGIDFPDRKSRAVVMIGIPFPAMKDPKVVLKMKYNTAVSCKQGGIDGNRWYRLQAFRAANQALGRCIRHKNDYGAILFLDSRYENPGSLANVSKWVRASVKPHVSVNHAAPSLQQFFEGLEGGRSEIEAGKQPQPSQAPPDQALHTQFTNVVVKGEGDPAMAVQAPPPTTPSQQRVFSIFVNTPSQPAAATTSVPPPTTQSAKTRQMPPTMLSNPVKPTQPTPKQTVETISKLEQQTVEPISKLEQQTVEPISKLEQTVEPISKLEQQTVEPISKLEQTVEPISKLEQQRGELGQSQSKGKRPLSANEGEDSDKKLRRSTRVRKPTALK